MATVELDHLTKRYASGSVAVRDFSLTVDDGEFLTLVGPSGCGKSTLLRMIAGLTSITSGELRINGVRMNDVAPAKRDIAMVFQNYALYPHKTVYENMAFSLKNAKIPKADIDAAVRRAATLLDLEQLLDRRPAALSGGQRQRVAMGRAIVRQPKVFLMDEPLSNLDAQLRLQMRTVIARLHAELGTTFIYVTHDQTEAMTLGTRIVVMKDGEIMQVGTPRDVHADPASSFVASFIGAPQMNLVRGRLSAGAAAAGDANSSNDEQLAFVAEDFSVLLDGSNSQRLRAAGHAGREVEAGIRPENMRIVAAGETAEGCAVIEATVALREPLGAGDLVHCDVGSTHMSVLQNVGDANRGSCVRLAFDTADIHFFDAETGLAL